MPSFNPNEYTTVAERLTRAADQLQTIVAEPPVMLTDVMGYIRATVALKDGRTSTGTASFRLDLTGGRAQATNPIEDCETSAIGRALGMLGYGSKHSVAGQEEIHEAERRREQPTNGNARRAAPEPTDEDKSTRVAIVSKYRQTITEAREKGVDIVGAPTKDMTNAQIKAATEEAQRLINAKVGGILPIGKPDLVD